MIILLYWNISSKSLQIKNFGRTWRKICRSYTRKKQESYGYHLDNFIGTSRQLNQTSRASLSWPSFFWQYRLRPQLQWIREKHQFILEPTVERLLNNAVNLLLANFQSEPCLLHGDFWNGNIICQKEQKARIVDPAVYCGDREADIAMAELLVVSNKIFLRLTTLCFPCKRVFASEQQSTTSIIFSTIFLFLAKAIANR